MNRVIKLKVLTQSELVKVETSARTFGELKKEAVVAALEIDWSSAKLIDRASKASFEVDEAVLPATDAIMFVMPTKSKAGADLPYKEVVAKINEFKAAGGVVPFNTVGKSAVELNKFWNSVKSVQQATEELTSDCTEAENLEVITLKPGKYILQVDGYDIEEVEEIQLVDDTTLDDLEDEAQMLMGRF